MTGRLFFIVNPNANNGKARQLWEKLRAYLAELETDYDFAFSQDAADVERLGREAASRADTIAIAVGGDGTLSRLAGALAGTGAVMGIIPAGTGNDLARSLAIPTDPAAAFRAIINGRTVALDLGRFNGTYFINVLGTGIDAEVAALVNRRFKRRWGAAGYVLALLSQLLVYRPRKSRLVLDGEEITADTWLVAVANGRYYGGGMMVAPHADPRDGLFEVVIVASIARLEFLRIFPRVYKGLHIEHPAVSVARAARVEINTDIATAVQSDGEITGLTPISVVMERHALKIRVPTA
jgi:YegS/Rv2252/BmrU family lipid kinase